MRSFIFIISLLVLLFSGFNLYSQCGDPLLEICYQKLGGFAYVNSFPVKMKKTKKGDPPNLLRQSVVLHSGVKYKFILKNAEEYEGKLVVNIYSNNNLVATSYEYSSGEFYDQIEFECQKSGVHYLVMYFDKGLPGCAMCLMGQFIFGKKTPN